mgnify:CR=1 FL=1
MAKATSKPAKRSASWMAVYETLRREILTLTLAPGEPLDAHGGPVTANAVSLAWALLTSVTGPWLSRR